jgi:hypothetical protein
VKATDNVSGIAAESLKIEVTSNEPVTASDIVIEGGIVQVRAQRSANGTGRIYTLKSQMSDVAGNNANVTATCTVPHDQSTDHAAK